MRVIERGWLSANAIVFEGPEGGALVDSGYCTHATQTLALVDHALQGRPLVRLFNTHLHSDHCGGNAALQQRYPALRTAIPPGQAPHVQAWNPEALSYAPTGQDCPAFRFDDLLHPGSDVVLGGRPWQVHAAPGHDPHAVLLFEPATATLISADALWGNGFGVVFPELEGTQAFLEVQATLDLIETLRPVTVLPGHGAVFTDVEAALARARERLAGFMRDPRKHAWHAAKVLLKYKLLEFQEVALADLWRWAEATPYFETIRERHWPQAEPATWRSQLLQDLVRSGAAAIDHASDGTARVRNA